MLSFKVLVKVAELLQAEPTLTTFFILFSTAQNKRFERLLFHFFEVYWHLRRDDLGFIMARGPMPVKVFASSKASFTLRTCVVRRALAFALLPARFLVPNSVSARGKTFFAKLALFGLHRNNMGSPLGILWGSLPNWGAIPIFDAVSESIGERFLYLPFFGSNFCQAVNWLT